uniref:EH domain-containing protein 1 n=1 Tax=Schistosoma haematobium TaxID=6185 RepID=A0A095C7R7_SCHHA
MKFSQTKEENWNFSSVVEGLRGLYDRRLKPLEVTYLFPQFHSPTLDAGEFSSKPMILLLGQYSTGKTTFIKYLLGSAFPGMHIGPEPTTDRFSVVMSGDEGIIPGNALVNPVLDSIVIIDTPGILSGEKQRLDRGYDFTAVVQWFAEHVDRIILLFDAYKLDISDEFRRVIESLRGYDDKVRIVLNKADMIDAQQLMRVYGALMWGLGKVLGTPEVVRVFIGSFWDRPLRYDVNRHLFELESQDLFKDLRSLPSNAAMRKLNDMIRRARLAKVHAYIIGHLKKQMPSIVGKNKKKQELINNLQQIYDSISRLHHVSPGDFPKLSHMQSILSEQDFTNFPSLKERLIEQVDVMLTQEIPKLMQMIPIEQTAAVQQGKSLIKGGAFNDSVIDSPFTADADMAINRGRYSDKSALEDDKDELIKKSGVTANNKVQMKSSVHFLLNCSAPSFLNEFESLQPVDGLLCGSGRLKAKLMESHLPNITLSRIWKLSDIDKDGYLDIDEFIVAKRLVSIAINGGEIPETLPGHLIPPSKHKYISPTINGIDDYNETKY